MHWWIRRGCCESAQVLRQDAASPSLERVRPAAGLRDEFAEVFRQISPSRLRCLLGTAGPGHYRAGRARAADAIREAGGFDEPDEWLFGWEQTYTRDQWLDLVPTTGGFTQNPPEISSAPRRLEPPWMPWAAASAYLLDGDATAVRLGT